MPARRTEPPTAVAAARLGGLDPERVLDAAAVEPGSTAVEVGAGGGAFTLPLARRVGERGRVVALDLSFEALAPLREAEESGRWPQLKVRLSEEARFPLPDRTADAAFLVHVLHELHGDATLREVRRVLRASGLLHVVDWDVTAAEEGPPLAHRVEEAEAIRFVENAGFQLVKWWDAAPARYGLTFRIA